MNRLQILMIAAAATGGALASVWNTLAEEPKIPRFSAENMDKSIDPKQDFYHFAAGTWLKNNPVPSHKSRWSGFEELQERNWMLIRNILESSAADTSGPAKSPKREVGDFFVSAMDTNRLEKLKFKPILMDLKRISRVNSAQALFELLANFHQRGISGLFGAGVSPDAKNSEIYAFHLSQGGLGLPDRDYYLKDEFTKQREDYREHVTKMFRLIGKSPTEAAAHAGIVLEIETTLAQASRTRVEMRDPTLNYNKFKVAQFASANSASSWNAYLEETGAPEMETLIVGQPDFFKAVDKMLKERPISDWKVYLRWHLLRSTAPYLHEEVEQESFAFYGTKLRGQIEQEPRWQRAAHTIDGTIGEALGQLFVEKHFPPEAKTRMNELIGNLREVFQDRLAKLDWMSEETRQKALAKFNRFTQKVGYPDVFRDYSKVKLRRNDYLGNVQRAAIFESHREIVRVGKPVDKTEWHMTPQTVNAYFNGSQNEIVFPAGILQPPFFDVKADDAVNYGAIGMVIGHEITHGYDDKGRQFDADGNLNEWWSEKDAKEFDARAQKVVDQYSSYEALPGLKVNGKLTLGENIADLGGASIAYEALQRALSKDPSKRKNIDGFTPEQRFFLSISQLWRTNWREAELRRRITVDPHSPGQFRAIGANVNLQEFDDAFGITAGAPMWRAPESRAKIW